MGVFDKYVDLLTDEALEERRAPNMGDLNLDPVVAALKVACADLVRGNDLSMDEIPLPVEQQILSDNFMNQLVGLLAKMQAYGPTSQNPSQERTELLREARGIKDQVLQSVRPILRPTQDIADALVSDLKEMKAEMAVRLEELSKQQQAVATTSGEAASTDLAKHYEDQADAHKNAANVMLWIAIGAGVALAALVLVTFAWKAPTTGDWTAFVRGSMLRLLLLSIGTVALVFCLRNYRVNKHLEVLNKRRENALNTFGLFQGAVTSEDARNFVVQELVRAVFAHEDTGYVQADTERTVIESPSGMLSVLAAARGKESGA